MRPVCIVLPHADALGMIVSACQSPPPHLKIKRAKAIVDDAGRKVLAEAGECYIRGSADSLR